jgi:hypothetical protein
MTKLGLPRSGHGDDVPRRPPASNETSLAGPLTPYPLDCHWS